MGARTAVEKLLEVFEEYEIAATWATVGFLFARDKAELARFLPARRPQYADTRLDSYSESVGENESDDPVHFGHSLIQLIVGTPRQEIGTHTFSHYFCGETGATDESFRADLVAAKSIARKDNIDIQSIVFPRNQVTESSLEMLPDVGIRQYRGNPECRWWRVRDPAMANRLSMRTGRLVESLLPIRDDTITWDGLVQPNGLVNVRASQFLRPCRTSAGLIEFLKLRRICKSIVRAAKLGRIYHLWWHPHNFGTYMEQNLQFLRRVLDAFVIAKRKYGMQSMTMAQIGEMARMNITPGNWNQNTG